MIFLHGHGPHDPRSLPQRLVELGHPWHVVQTGMPPGSPEMEQPHLATLLLQAQELAVKVGDSWQAVAGRGSAMVRRPAACTREALGVALTACPDTRITSPITMRHSHAFLSSRIVRAPWCCTRRPSVVVVAHPCGSEQLPATGQSPCDPGLSTALPAKVQYERPQI